MPHPIKLYSTVTAWLLLFFVTSSWALEPALIIESRQASYREMGGAYKGIRDELQKKRPLMIMIRQHTDQLQMLAHSQAHADWFPVGTGVEAEIETEASDVIWQKKPKFDRFRSELNEQANGLVKIVASKDLRAITKQHRAVGRICKQCHKTYREKD